MQHFKQLQLLVCCEDNWPVEMIQQAQNKL